MTTIGKTATASARHVARPSSIWPFLIVWIGQAVSMVGSGLTSFALGVWLLQETGEATPFALTILFASFPSLLLAPLAGSLVDRWNRRWLMVVADTGDALVTLGAAALVATGGLQVWHVYGIALVSAVFAAFQRPAYESSISLLVPEKDLARANGLVQAAHAGQSLLSPLLAGALVGLIGLHGIFVVDFVTYFAAIITVLLIKIPQPSPSEVSEVANETVSGRVRRDFAFGLRFLRDRPGLLGLLIYFALINFLLNLAFVLTGPLVLSFSDPATLGVIQMASGAAMLVGSIVISAWGGPKRRIVGVVGIIAVGALGELLVGLRPSPVLIGLGISWLLFCIPIASGCSSAIFQANVPSEVQGRVFAVRSMVASSIMPIAFLLAGPLADRVFEPLMAADGVLGRGWLGQVVGRGTGRGIALIYLLSALLIVVTSAVAWADPRIRNVDVVGRSAANAVEEAVSA